jgi:NTE family protein
MPALDLPRPVAFVLGGGGSLGAAHVGMLQALEEVDVAADMVIGTSVGSLNGAVLAENPRAGAHRLTHAWEQISRDDVFPGGLLAQLHTLERSRTYLFDNAALRATAKRLLRTAAIDDLTVPYAAVATDLDRGEVVLLREGALVDAVLASAAIPGVFPLVGIGGRRLCDGGVVANVPILQAFDLKPASIVVLDCIGLVPSTMDSLPDILLHAFSISCHYQPMLDAPLAARRVPVVYLPTPTITGSLLDFDLTAQLMENAYESSRAFLGALAVDPVAPRLYHPDMPEEPSDLAAAEQAARGDRWHWPWRRHDAKAGDLSAG